MSYNTKAVIGWCAGILATVISSVAIYYLTRPAPAPTPSPAAASTPAPPASIFVEGRVVDTAASKIITNAIVGLQTGGLSVTQPVDSAGSYLIQVDGLPEMTAATLTIDAPGYPRFSANSTLARLSDPGVDNLVASSAPPPPAGGGAGRGARGPILGAVIAKNLAQRGAVVVHPAPVEGAPAQVLTLPPYVRRADPAKITKAPAH
jgi:hypothetical protein